MLTYKYIIMHKGPKRATVADMLLQAHVHIHKNHTHMQTQPHIPPPAHTNMPESLIHGGWPGTSTHRLSGQAELDRCPTCPQGVIPKREGCWLIILQCIPSRDKQPQASPARPSHDGSPLWIPPTCSAVLGQHRSRRRDTDTWQEPATNPLGFFLHQGPYGCPGSVPFGDIHTGKEGRGNKPYMQVRRGLREPCCPPQTTDTLLYHPVSRQSLNSGSVWDPLPHGVTIFTPWPPHHSPTPALLLLRCASEGKDPDSPTPPAHPSPTFQLLSQGW